MNFKLLVTFLFALVAFAYASTIDEDIAKFGQKLKTNYGFTDEDLEGFFDGIRHECFFEDECIINTIHNLDAAQTGEVPGVSPGSSN